MKKMSVLIILACVGLFASAIIGNKAPDPIAIPAYAQRIGNAQKGYDYILSSAYISSGLPFYLYQSGFGTRNTGYLDEHDPRLGYDFSFSKAHNTRPIVAPNCFQCHAEILDGELMLGLGNTTKDFTAKQIYNIRPMQDLMLRYLQWVRPKEYDAAWPFARATLSIDRQVFTHTRGVNGADRLFAMLVAHRDESSLAWSDSILLALPAMMIPSDVPAWWLLKKKNAMFYSGEGRGDFGKFIMSSSLLTLKDSVEAASIDPHMPDVLSYILSIKAPPYPGRIDAPLAVKGQGIFNAQCSSCHGTYGADAAYPNRLVASAEIGTDPWLSRSNFLDTAVTRWYNNSWFSRGNNRSWIQPFDGYIAPPLDGIWATAPYLHNGSVPSLSMMLDSRSRPAYWRRKFNKQYYDIDAMALKYEPRKKPGGKLVYDTSIPGYGNQGHTFGDALSREERRAVIEYLKTI